MKVVILDTLEPDCKKVVDVFKNDLNDADAFKLARYMNDSCCDGFTEYKAVDDDYETFTPEIW